MKLPGHDGFFVKIFFTQDQLKVIGACQYTIAALTLLIGVFWIHNVIRVLIL